MSVWNGERGGWQPAWPDTTFNGQPVPLPPNYAALLDRKARIDACRRYLERVIADGHYRPTMTPDAWWRLWDRIERECPEHE